MFSNVNINVQNIGYKRAIRRFYNFFPIPAALIASNTIFTTLLHSLKSLNIKLIHIIFNFGVE